MRIGRVFGVACISALVIAMAGCAQSPTPTAGGTPSTVPTSAPTTVLSSAPAAATSGPTTPAGNGTPTGKPKKPDVSCTNQINYAGDPRPNAEINSIGEDTGYCPPIKNAPGVKCTDQLPYAGDTRSNAEINSIGDRTGYCPFEQTS